MKSARIVGAALAIAWLVSAMVAGATLGESTGDVYVSSSSGVLEVVVASASVLDTVLVTPPAGALAVRPDGRELFVVTGTRGIDRVDLASLSVTGRFQLPAPAAGLAYPEGGRLIAALPSRRRLAVIDVASGTVSESDPLAGPVDLVAADPRDGRILAATQGGRWAAIFDPSTGRSTSVTTSGTVSAVALDSSGGLALVATSSPNAVVAFSLRTGRAAWTATLAGAPAAIVVVSDRVVTATGRTLWSIDAGTAAASPPVSQWAVAASAVLSLAASDKSTTVYAREATRLEAFDAGAAGTPASRTIALTGGRAPIAMAAVPGAASSVGGPGQANGATAGSGSTVGTARIISSGRAGPKPPPTDTVIEPTVRWVDLRPLLPGALAVGLVILVAGLLAIHWYERRAGA